jgi:hypothetical protein
MWRVSDVNWQLCQLIHYVIDHKLPHICMNVTHGARNYLLQQKMSQLFRVTQLLLNIYQRDGSRSPLS